MQLICLPPSIHDSSHRIADERRDHHVPILLFIRSLPDESLDRSSSASSEKQKIASMPTLTPLHSPVTEKINRGHRSRQDSATVTAKAASSMVLAI